MRRLTTKFDTNGSRAIVVPKKFAADIAGKYGPARRRAQAGRSALVYRSSMTGKKKPLSVKPATIVRVQVVMPQPAQIVKLQETRVLRERVIEKDNVVKKPTDHRERAREKPIVRERIVERDKPVVRERIVEREKPIVRERIVEREKPIVRERIVERERPPSETALKRPRQQNTNMESGQTNAPGSRDPIRSAIPTLGRTIAKRAERNEDIKTLFKRQSKAREFAFRLLEAEAGRSSESSNTVEIAIDAGPIEKTESASYSDSIDSRSSRNMTIANRGSREPIRLQNQRSPDVRQDVPVSSRGGASRQWNAVVMINRRTMDRIKTLSARISAPNLMKQATGRGDILADRAQESPSVQQASPGAQPKQDETRDAQSLQRESIIVQNAPWRPDANSGTDEQQALGASELARPVNTDLARTNEIARDSEPIDKLAVDKRLIGDDSSIDRVSVTMSEALPAEMAFPIALRTIDHSGLTVRLIAARAERLGSTFVLRNRTEPGTAEAGIPSSSKLILRRLTANPNMFITARRATNGATALDARNAAMKDAERSGLELTQPMQAPAGVYPTTVKRESAHAQPATPKSDSGPQGNPVTSSDSSAIKLNERERSASASPENLTWANGSFRSKSMSSKRIAGQSEKSAVPPTSAGQGVLRLSGRVKARLDAPGGFAASAPRAMPTGMIVHASRRGLSVLGRITSRTDIGEAGTATPQTKAAQPNAAQQNAVQTNTVQPNAVIPNAVQLNAPLQSAAQPYEVGANPGSNFSAANASAIAPTISANGASPSVRKPLTEPAIKHPSDESKLGFENAAQGSSNRSPELTHVARTEPAMSEGSGQIPRVRFTFRNRLNGSFAPSKPPYGDRAGDIQRRPTAADRESSADTPLASRTASVTNRRDSASKIGNPDARPVNLHWIARTSRSMTAARSQSSASNRTGRLANRTAADWVQTTQLTQPRQTTHPIYSTQMTQPMHPMQMTLPMTRQLLAGSESFPGAPVQPEEHPLVMAPSPVPTALRRTRQSEARMTSVKPSLASAPAMMELRRNAAQPANALAEPAPAAVTVEAPPHIDAKQLQKAIESMPQLNPDQLAERVYAALMKKMKFERRLRGY